MFVDPVGYQAQRIPDAVAVCLPDVDVSYRSLDRFVNALARGLRPEVAPGTRVAVTLANRYLHWLYLLALGRLGAVTASLDATRGDALLPLVAPDVVVTDGSASRSLREIVASPEALKALVAGNDGSPLAPLSGMDAPARLILSSGTTGLPKLVELSRATLTRRLASTLFMGGEHWSRRTLTIIGVESLSGYTGPLRNWMAGGAACFLTPDIDSIRKRGVTALTGSPQQFDSLLATLPACFVPPPNMSAMVMGGVITPQFSMRLRVKLAPRAFALYGSTEMGAVATAPMSRLDAVADLAGILIPGCVAEAVDAGGAVLAAGEVGEIRLRSDEMVRGYVGDPAATRRQFRDGWFYTGDLGSVSATGELKILGRVDQVLNVGGVKVLPESIEETLRTVPGIRDVAVFVAEGRDGVRNLYAAVISDVALDEAAALAEVNRQLTIGQVSLGFVRVDSIPRNAMGKIQRADLARQFEAARRRREGTPA
jgi:acyl-CoA synthetase (AMP-forming)/AMP-acid ligase II